MLLHLPMHLTCPIVLRDTLPMINYACLRLPLWMVRYKQNTVVEYSAPLALQVPHGLAWLGPARPQNSHWSQVYMVECISESFHHLGGMLTRMFAFCTGSVACAIWVHLWQRGLRRVSWSGKVSVQPFETSSMSIKPPHGIELEKEDMEAREGVWGRGVQKDEDL